MLLGPATIWPQDIVTLHIGFLTVFFGGLYFL